MRQLRYFVVLADELHFTRAAVRLSLTQQSLSAQIRKLEERVGVALVRRTTRSVELTPAGAAFLERARQALSALDSAVDEAHRSAASATLSVGFMLSAALELTAPILTEFARRHRTVSVELRDYSKHDPSLGLASGDSDVSFVRMPISLPEARFARLFVEPLVVAVSTAHPLAGRERVSVEEILDEDMSSPVNDDPAWNAFWMLERYRDGPPVTAVRGAATVFEDLEMVALGRHITIIPLAASRLLPRSDIRFVAIDGVAGSEVALGWRADRDSDLVQAFVATALEVRDRETEILARIQRDDDARQTGR